MWVSNKNLLGVACIAVTGYLLLVSVVQKSQPDAYADTSPPRSPESVGYQQQLARASGQEDDAEVMETRPVLSTEDDAQVMETGPVLLMEDDAEVKENRPVLSTEDDAEVMETRPVLSTEDDAEVKETGPVLSTEDDVQVKQTLPDVNRKRVEVSTKAPDTATGNKVKGEDLSKAEPRLPKCLIIGFCKAGTSALRTFIDLHPDIVAPDFEISFFDIDSNYKKGLDWYRKQMPPSLPHQITVEKTPTYIKRELYLQRIMKFNSTIKLLVIMTDPIVHCQSTFARIQHEEPGTVRGLSFEDWIDAFNILHKSVYATQLQTLFQMFPREQIFAVDGDAMIRDPAPVLQEVEQFLHIRPAITRDFFFYDAEKGFHCINATRLRSKVPRHVIGTTGCFGSQKGREHAEIRPALRRRMAEAFVEHNERVFEIIGKRFDWASMNG